MPSVSSYAEANARQLANGLSIGLPEATAAECAALDAAGTTGRHLERGAPTASSARQVLSRRVSRSCPERRSAATGRHDRYLAHNPLAPQCTLRGGDH